MENFDYKTIPLYFDTEGIILIDYEDTDKNIRQQIIQIRTGMFAKYMCNDYGEYITITNDYKLTGRTTLRDVQSALRNRRIMRVEYVLILGVVPDNIVDKTSFIFGTMNEDLKKSNTINYLVDGGNNNNYEILTIQFSLPVNDEEV